MRIIKGFFAWTFIGFLLNALVSVIFSWVSYSSARNERYTPGPEIGHIVTDRSAGIVASTIDSFGYRRRGWYFDPGFSASMPPGLPFNSFTAPRRTRFDIPFENGPFFAWTLGSDAGWGLLYSTELETLEQVRQFGGFECAAGFPALSFWNELIVERDESTRTPGGIRLPDPNNMFNPRYEARAIPYRPIWAGLIFNTVFYAVLAYAIHHLYRIIREHRRYTKGNCPRCAYALNADFAPGCPECGWRKAQPKPTTATKTRTSARAPARE